MRSKQVTINEKNITIKEKKVFELKELFADISTEADVALKANTASDLTGIVNNILGPNLIKIFPAITQEDIDNAYPSELEELVGAFIEVNFTGIKKVATPFMSMIQTGLQKR